jgi:hypothetical protein
LDELFIDAKSSKTSSLAPTLCDLARVQTFDGSWERTPQLDAWVAAHAPNISDALTQFCQANSAWVATAAGSRWLATHLARVLLRALFAQNKDEWLAADQKAARWQKRQPTQPPINSIAHPIEALSRLIPVM